MSEIGHNGGPQLDEKQKPIRREWAKAIFAHPDKPVGAVAMAFVIYTRMTASGEGATVSDQEFSDFCGVGERRIRDFKKWLLDAGFIVINLRGTRGSASTFKAVIPEQTPAADCRSLGAEHRQPAAADPKHRQPIAGNPLPTPAADCRSFENTGSPLPVIGDHRQPIAGNPLPHAGARAHLETSYGGYSLDSGEGVQGERLPEIDGLNGSTSDLVDQLAGYLAGDLRPKELDVAWDILNGNVDVYGAQKVKIGMLEMKAAHAAGLLKRGDLVKAFNGFVKRARLPDDATSAEDAMRQAEMRRLDAICGGRR